MGTFLSRFNIAEMKHLDKFPIPNYPASMGPRLFSRGNLVDLAEKVLFDALQWGRDSSVAEIPLPFGMEGCVIEASMGPRLFSRGNDIFGPLFMPGPANASLGPRLFSRGNLGMEVSPAVEFPLQWGRDSSVAEMDAAETRQGGASQLQWGRDSSVAEIAPTHLFCCQ